MNPDANACRANIAWPKQDSPFENAGFAAWHLWCSDRALSTVRPSSRKAVGSFVGIRPFSLVW